MTKKQTKTAKEKTLTKKEKIEIYSKAQDYLIKSFKDLDPSEIMMFFNAMKDEVTQEQFEIIIEGVEEFKKDIVKNVTENTKNTNDCFKFLVDEIKELKEDIVEINEQGQSLGKLIRELGTPEQKKEIQIQMLKKKLKNETKRKV